MISVALQENPLFTATLRDNISYGRIGARPEEILRAVARAGLADFVAIAPRPASKPCSERKVRSFPRTGPTYRAGARIPAQRAHPDSRRTHVRARFRHEDLVMRGVRDWIAERPRERTSSSRRIGAAPPRLPIGFIRISDGRVLEADHRAFDVEGDVKKPIEAGDA